MNFRISSLKKRITAALLSTAMFFNMTSFPVDYIQAGNNQKKINGVDVIWNETEELWETVETTNVFDSYTFSAYWDPREKTLDYFWDATSGSGINSQETKIIFTFNSSNTNNEWKVNGGGTGISPDGTTTNKYDEKPDIWFEIPGIASAKRGEKQAPLLGQDSKSIVCDGYNLEDDKAVYELKTDVRTLNGGMEIVWGYNPRELVNGYGLKDGSELTDAIGDTFDYDENKSLHPCAYIKVYNQENDNYELVKVRLPEMHFGFVSERDNVLVDLNEGEQDNLDSGKLDSNYTWKRVYTEFYTYAKTRPIDDSKFYIELKKDDVDAFGSENVYLKNGENYTLVDGSGTITRDGISYYLVQIDYNSLEKWSSQTNAGLSSKSSPVDLYLGVKKEAIINRATAEYERDYSENNNRINELTAKSNLTIDEENELNQLITDKNNAIRNYIVTTDNGVETLNYKIKVNSRIVRSYADEEGNTVDYDIPQNEQGSIISGDIEIKTDNNPTANVKTTDFYRDTHIDSAIFGFRADPTYGSGGIAITKSSGNPLRTSSDMASGNRDKYKVSIKSTNMAGTYDVTIKDDCLIVLLDDKKTDYNQPDENGNIIQDFSYEYSTSKSKSQYRLVQPDEYDFISLTMPKYSNTLDVSGTQKSFNYDVMLTIWDSETNTTRIEKLTKGNGEEYNTVTQEHIDLTGRNVKAIEIKLKGVEGSLDNYTPEFEVKFNLKNDDSHGGEYRSGTGSLNALAADPYGKLINFAMVYAKQTEGDVYYGESTNDNNPPDRYNGYVDSSMEKFVYKGNTLYDNGGEYLTNTEGKNIYAIRSSADLFIRDPAVDVSTNTSYKKSNGAVIDLEQTTIDGITEATIKTAGQFYTELTSKLNMVPTKDTRFDKLIIRTVMPKVLADANGMTGTSKLSLSNVNIQNITLVENGTSKPLTTSDLITYYDRSNTYYYNSNNSTTSGQEYVEIITELDFSGKDAHIEIPKGITGSISLTYPLFMNYSTENNWKNQINLDDFYGATTAEIIPSSPMSITGNGTQGISGNIKNYYVPSSEVQASSAAVNKLPTTASSWNEIAIKTVKSTLNKGSLDSPGTFGKYAEVNMLQGNDTDVQKKMADYEYKLYFQMGNTEASRIFIYDNIEEAEDYDTALKEDAVPSESEWHGTLKNVVVTGSETNLNTTGSDTTLKATVFYSTSKISSDLYLNSEEYVAEPDINDKNDTRNTPEGNDWTKAEEYSTKNKGDLSGVKAFCVMVEGVDKDDKPTHIAKAQEIYFTVQMTAPEKTNSNDSKINIDTYNKFTVRYARLQNDGGRDESFKTAFPNYPINSNHTTVTLRDKILKLKIVKTDMERKNKWSDDTHYMPISGAKFKIYSYKNGNETAVQNKLTNQYDFETDEYGEITVNLAEGWYILKESDAPKGYRTANEILFYVNATNDEGNPIYNKGQDISDSHLKVYKDNAFVLVDSNDENRNVFLKYTGSEEVYAENGNTVSMHTLQLEVADEIIPGKVTITKYDETYKNIMDSLEITSYEEKTVAGVSYCLYKANGTKLGDPVYVTKETNGEYKCVKSQNESSSQGTTSNSNTVETDANGKIIITELPWGSFFLVEQSAPVGYEVPDTTDRSKYVSFSITPDLNTDEDKNYLITDDVSAWDKETGLSVELTKYDWDDKTKTTKISNAEFNLEIYNQETKKWESWDGYHNKITQNGSITFTNGTMPVLAFGQKYRIVEINPAADYKKPEDPYSIEFDFTGDELDNTSGSPIYSEAYEVIRNEEDNSTTNVKVKKTIYPVDTSSQGKTIKKVKVIKCEAENETHILSESEFKLTINENDRTVKADISMYNERKQSKLTIFKTDKDGNALAGAAFALYEVVGTADSLLLDNKGKLQFDSYGGVVRTANGGEDTLLMSRKVTDAEGKIEIPDNLEWDKEYYLVEMNSPKGYKQNNEIIGPFKLRDEIKKPASETSLVQISNQEDTINLQWNVENEQIPGSVTLRKYAGNEKGNKVTEGKDSNGNDIYKMLAGAKFKLVNNKGETVINTGTGDKAIKVNGTYLENNAPLENMLTNDNGVLTIENLPWGYGYQLIETEAPSGYDTVEIKKFSIDANHTVIEKEAIDPVKTTSLTIRKSVNEWRKAFGDATFIFKVKEMDENGTSYTGKEYTKMVTINEEDTIDTDGRRRDSVTFYGLDASKKYEVTEILVARYTLDDIITATDSTATIEKDINTYKTTRKCIVTLKADENNSVAKNEIEYKNNLTYYDKFSENKTEPNPIEKQQMITGVNFRVDTSKLDPNTFGLVQPSISDTYYDFFPKDESGNLIKDTNENGIASYRSDALVVKIYPDRTSDDETDTQNEGIRIYPKGHELYDATVGYYELVNHTETENNVTTTYVSGGKVYYLQSPRDENLKILVTLPDTSQYSWATTNHEDSDIIHIDLADMPMPITLKFHPVSQDVSEPYDNGTYQPVRIGGSILGETDTYDLQFNYNDETGKYEIANGKTLTVPKVYTDTKNITFSYWTLNGTPIESISMEDFVNNYVNRFREEENGDYVLENGVYKLAETAGTGQYSRIATNDGQTFEFYPVYVVGRAMFDKTKLKNYILKDGNKSVITKVKQSPTQPTDLTGWSVVSVSNSTYPLDICAKVDENGVFWWYSQDSTPYAPTSMSSLFYWFNALNDIDGLYNWDTSQTNNMQSLFQGCTSLVKADLENWDTHSINGGEDNSFKSMFEGCTNLENVNLTINTAGKNVSMKTMFRDCTHDPITVTITGDFSGISTSRSMFYKCYKLNNLNLNHISMEPDSSSNELKEVDTKSEPFQNCTTFYQMFISCSVLTAIPGIEDWNTSKATDMSKMFQNCSALPSIDVSHFDTSQVETMQEMFRDCYGLTSIDVSHFDTSNVTNMEYIFYNCSGLTSIDVSNFNTSKVTTMNRMFSECSGLTSIDVSNFNTSKVEKMDRMFYKCSALESINGLYKFDTSSCTSFDSMFYECKKLKVIDISSFTTGQGTRPLTLKETFKNCYALETIYANPKEWPHNESGKLNELNSVFSSCTSLTLKGNNTSSNVIMAVVDGAPFEEGKGNSSFTYQTRTDANGNTVYTGYFTDWKYSEHYEEVKAAYEAKFGSGS